jgi:hypothetical protein
MQNSEFLRAVYGAMQGGYGWTASFRADPNEAGPSAWAGAPWSGSTLIDDQPGHNNFYCVGIMRSPDTPRRSKELFERLAVLLADDVDPVDVGYYSYAIETSPGNYQVGLILDQDDPDTHDRNLIDAVLQSLRAEGIVNADASGNNPVRYARLPVGTNTKKRLDVPFAGRLEHSDMGVVYSLSEAVGAFGLDLDAIRQNVIRPAPERLKTPPSDSVNNYAALLRQDPAERSYHDSLLRISSSLIAAGAHPGAVVNHLREIGEAIKPPPGPEQERWRERFGAELIRMVGSAEKFAPEPELPINEEDDDCLESLAQLRDRAQDIRWIVDDLLPADSMGMIFGASGTFKSFIAIDAAMHIASGSDWCLRKTVAGPVVYVASEGGLGIYRRVNAWHQQNGLVDLVDNFKVCSIPLLLTAKDQIARLKRSIARMPVAPSLVVIDTLAASFSGDENSASDISAYLRSINAEIRAEFNCTVIVVHHTGHSATERPRGSSAILANLDFVLGVFRDDATAMNAKLTVAKQKDGEKAPDAHFDLSRVVLGATEEGKEISSLVAEYKDTGAAMREHVSMGRYADLIMSMLMDTPRMTQKDLIEGCMDEAKGARATATKGVGRALSALRQSGYVTSPAPGIWRIIPR